MSDERKECKDCIKWTQKTDIGYCQETHTENVDSNDYCELYEKREVQQQPKIDEKYVEGKAEKMKSMFLHPNTPETNQYKCEDFITQIISDAQGMQIEVDEEFIVKWKKIFKSMDGCYTPSKIMIDFMDSFIRDAGVKIKK